MDSHLNVILDYNEEYGIESNEHTIVITPTLLPEHSNNYENWVIHALNYSCLLKNTKEFNSGKLFDSVGFTTSLINIVPTSQLFDYNLYSSQSIKCIYSTDPPINLTLPDYNYWWCTSLTYNVVSSVSLRLMQKPHQVFTKIKDLPSCSKYTLQFYNFLSIMNINFIYE